MKTNETGRSMIEMLGVLAIIGVLSVGGIAGYSKAMNVYKVNKTIDQLMQIAASTRALFAGHKTYEALGKNTKMALIKKSHLVPDEMMVLNNGALASIENAYGGQVVLSNANKGNRTDKAFTVSFSMIPQSSCMELATKDWGQGRTSGLYAIKINNTEFGQDSLPVTVGQALSACTNSINNTMIWTFY